jgi:folate-binding protein YgfZ
VAEFDAGAGAGWVARRSRYGEAGFTLAVPAGAAAAFAQRLAAAGRAAGLEPAGPAARETLRVEAGRVLGGVDVGAADLLAEAGLGAAVSLAKGCFPGQEILRRIARQGSLRRRLCGLVLERGAAVAAGDAVVGVAGEPWGALTSAADSPGLGALVALAWLGEPAGAPGAALRVRSAAGLFAGRVSGLPFASGAAGPLAETPTYPERTATRP